MKNLLKILSVALFLLFIPTIIIAQEIKTDENNVPKNINTTKYFDLELVHSSQSPFTKSITYTLNIRPLMDSPETEILWSYPATLDVKLKHKRFIAMKEGQLHTVKIVVKPKSSGTYNLSASVISWQHDTNYTNSVGDTLSFDKNLVLQPVSSEYKTTSILFFIGIALILGVGGFVVVKLANKGAAKAKKWLTPPS